MAGLVTLDTNALLAIDQGILSLEPGVSVILSVIVRIEVLSFPMLSVADSHRLRSWLDDFRLVGITSDIEARTIAIQQETRLKLPDAIIAATAMEMKSALVTRDEGFNRVPGLEIRTF